MLYLHCRDSHEARPKAISGRTSYLRVRLAFHPYPQLIRTFCNRCRFGPPRALTRASPWPWIAHPVSGRPHATHRRPFGLGFPPAPGITPLASPHTVTRRFVLQKARDHARAYTPTRSRSVSAHGFRICFTPLDGVLFTIPSRYCSLSVARGIQPWRVVPPASDGISRVPPYSRVPTRARPLSPTGLSPFSRPLPAAFG